MRKKEYDFEPDKYGAPFPTNLRKLLEDKDKRLKAQNQKGTAQNRLAEYCGVQPTSVSDWKNGKKKPTYDNLEKIAFFFGISVSSLLNDEKRAKISIGDNISFDNEKVWKAIEDSTDNVDMQCIIEDLHERYTDIIRDMLLYSVCTGRLLIDKRCKHSVRIGDCEFSKKYIAYMIIHNYCQKIERVLMDSATLYSSVKPLSDYVINNSDKVQELFDSLGISLDNATEVPSEKYEKLGLSLKGLTEKYEQEDSNNGK